MKYIFIHGLGQGPDSWNKTVSCMREQEEIQCLNVFAFKEGSEISYRKVYKAFSAYCESIKTEFGLCGLSLGAVIALNYVVEHPGKVLLSGYDNDLYNQMLIGWRKVSKKTQAEAGIPRVETLWMNYEIGQVELPLGL